VRAAGQVGSSLQAEVEIRAAGDNFELLTSLGDDLRFVLICSKATVVQVASDADAAIVVTPSAHKKCERCWHYRDDVGHDAAHPELCGRCTSNLHGAGEARRVA
jgi:isoleucyl-tRNA synthetase